MPVVSGVMEGGMFGRFLQWENGQQRHEAVHWQKNKMLCLCDNLVGAGVDDDARKLEGRSWQVDVAVASSVYTIS